MPPGCNCHRSLQKKSFTSLIASKLLQCTASIAGAASSVVTTLYTECRKISQLEQQLAKATERADKAEHCGRQAQAESAASVMVRQNLESDLDALRKQMVALENTLKSVTKQQKVMFLFSPVSARAIPVSRSI